MISLRDLFEFQYSLRSSKVREVVTTARTVAMLVLVEIFNAGGLRARVLPIERLLVLADVIVVTEVEVHFLPALRWSSIFLLKFLGRLWPILIRVDRWRLIAAVPVEMDRVQDFIIGHL